jgi:hypothetical protein
LNVEPDVSGWQAPNTKGRAAAKPVRR